MRMKNPIGIEVAHIAKQIQARFSCGTIFFPCWPGRTKRTSAIRNINSPINSAAQIIYKVARLFGAEEDAGES